MSGLIGREKLGFRPVPLGLYIRRRRMENHELIKASEATICPLCGEHDDEWLLRHDEHTVECQMCGTQFPTE